MSTSERAPPTSCRFPCPQGWVLSGSHEPTGVPALGDAFPLWPRQLAGVPSGRAAQDWRHEEEEVWQCHSSHGGQRGRVLSRPNKEIIRNTTHYLYL